MIFAQEGLGVEIFSPLGILILVIGVTFTVGLPVAMIKYGKKDQHNSTILSKIKQSIEEEENENTSNNCLIGLAD